MTPKKEQADEEMEETPDEGELERIGLQIALGHLTPVEFDRKLLQYRSGKHHFSES